MSDLRLARRRTAPVVMGALWGLLLLQPNAHADDGPHAETTVTAPASTPPPPPSDESSFRGHSCVRVSRETGPSDPNPIEWLASAKDLVASCGNLGCVDDPKFDAPEVGICAPPQLAADCAGIGINPATKRCALPANPLKLDSDTLRAVRFMLTTSGIVISGMDSAGGAHPNVLAGLYYEVALKAAHVVKVPEGGFRYEGITPWYLHLGLAGTRALFTHDVGVVLRLPSSTFTRLGVTAYGVLVDEPTPTDRISYRVGPEVNLEIMNNILIKGAALPLGTELGPRWMAGVEYMARLFDDVLPNSH